MKGSWRCLPEATLCVRSMWRSSETFDCFFRTHRFYLSGVHYPGPGSRVKPKLTQARGPWFIPASSPNGNVQGRRRLPQEASGASKCFGKKFEALFLASPVGSAVLNKGSLRYCPEYWHCPRRVRTIRYRRAKRESGASEIKRADDGASRM